LFNQTSNVRRPSAVYAKAVMYKRTVPVLFDSGCDRSVVHSRLLPSDLQLRPTTEKLFTADKTELPLLGETVIKFVINGVRFSADVVVSPAIEGLFLGADWMKCNKAIMNFDDETIAVKGDSIRLHARPDAASTR
jgi:predicted aspartyl protease